MQSSASKPAHRAVGPSSLEAAAWVGLYFFLAVAPLFVVLLATDEPSRGFWAEFAVAIGFIALAMFALQFVLTARFRHIASPFGIDTLLHYHRQAGLVAFVFALAHPIILILSDPDYAAFLDPRDELPRALALWGVLGALVLIIGLTLARKRLKFPYEWWRLTHGLLAFFIVFVGLVHVIRVDYYVSSPVVQALWIGATGAAMALLVHERLLKPLRLKRKPWKVVSVTPEEGQTWTLEVEPVGHEGMPYAAGQFAWLTLGPSPFSLEQHPFSFASSAKKPHRLSFTIKELGGYTSAIGKTEPGTPAFLEGPYGAFTLSPDASGAVLIAGGVGITPVMSILRTARDAKDRRPFILIYATKDWESVIFREELGELRRELDLKIVHVVENPPEDWSGESGFVRPELLGRHLPADNDRLQYLLCGPEPMMDVVERYLHEANVPVRRRNAERFNIA